MKKINWKILNLSLWAEVVLSLLWPFYTADSFKYQVGFPISYISVYPTRGNMGVNPLMSMYLNPARFLMNAILIYLIVSLIITGYKTLVKAVGKKR